MKNCLKVLKMNKSISFLIGAGFSAPFNIPTMKPFLTSFEKFAELKYPNLKEALDNHLQKLEAERDIEDLLSNLGKAEGLPLAMPSPSDMDASLIKWSNDSRFIKAYLVSYIIERCEQFDRERAIDEIVPFFELLDKSDKFSEVHLFTTNYDRILEYVAEYANIEMDDGFGDSKTDLVAPWTRKYKSKLRLYKLHGSVTYYVDRKSGASDEFLRLDRGYPIPDPDFRLSRSGK